MYTCVYIYIYIYTYNSLDCRRGPRLPPGAPPLRRRALGDTEDLYILMYIYIYIYINMCVYIYIYIYTHICNVCIYIYIYGV